MTPAEKTRMLAERVMGWHYWDSAEDYDGPRPMFAQVGEEVWFYGSEDDPIQVWDPLANLSHAGEVLEAMLAKGWDYVASTCATSKRHWVEFIPPHHAKQNHGKLYAYANELSTAICHAALLAEGVKEDEL